MKFKYVKRSAKNAFLNVIGNFLNPMTFFVLILFVIAVSWIPDGLSNFLSLYVPEKILSVIQIVTGIALLLILFSAGSYFIKQRQPVIDVELDKPKKRKNLILFLSPNNADLSNVKKIEDFQKVKTPWQMPIVAIHYHLPELENIFVILSSISKDQFSDFESLVKKLFLEKNLNIIPVGIDKEIDFEDMEQINKIVEDTYDFIKKEFGAKEKDIIIDVTGGQKIVSIVGAVQTFKYDREFQYVSTSNYEVKSFNVKYYEE